VEIVTLTAPDWTYTFVELPRYDEEDSRIVYTAEEVEVPEGYAETSASVDLANGDLEITITNTYVGVGVPPVLRNLTVIKDWTAGNIAPNLRPEYLEIQLLANGVELPARLGILNDSNDWIYTFANLPVYDLEGEEIVYTIVVRNQTQGIEKTIGAPIVLSNNNIEITITSQQVGGGGGGTGGGDAGTGDGGTGDDTGNEGTGGAAGTGGTGGGGSGTAPRTGDMTSVLAFVAGLAIALMVLIGTKHLKKERQISLKPRCYKSN